MKKQLLQILVSTLISQTCFAQLSNINISNTTMVGSEPYMAVNPTDPQNIVVAWMALDASTGFKMSIKSKVSLDGGTTWGNQFIQPHFSSTWNSADVSMQFRKNGTLYLDYIDFRQSPDSGGVYVTHSTNGGVAWSAPVRVWNGNTEAPTKLPFDRPWLIADNSGSTNDGLLYLTTKPAPWIVTPNNRPYLKTSADSGQTWSSFRYVDTLNYLVGSFSAPMASPAVAADGALCIAYPSYNTSQSPYMKFLLAKSYNKGATFKYHDIISNPGLASQPNYKKAWHLSANPANASQLAFSYVGGQHGDPDIFVTTTNDSGSTWNVPVRVNDDVVSNGKGQDLVWTTYSNNGDLLVTWRDRRNASGTGFSQSTDIYYAVSKNNGASYQANAILTNTLVPDDTALTLSDNAFMGCHMLNDTVYATWGDVRTGKLNIFFAKAVVGSTAGVAVIKNIAEDELFTVFVDPAGDKLFIKTQQKDLKYIQLEIFNETGQEIISEKLEVNIQQSVIDISRFVSGVYFVRGISDTKQVCNNKIIISK